MHLWYCFCINFDIHPLIYLSHLHHLFHLSFICTWTRVSMTIRSGVGSQRWRGTFQLNFTIGQSRVSRSYTESPLVMCAAVQSACCKQPGLASLTCMRVDLTWLGWSSLQPNKGMAHWTGISNKWMNDWMNQADNLYYTNFALIPWFMSCLQAKFECYLRGKLIGNASNDMIYATSDHTLSLQCPEQTVHMPAGATICQVAKMRDLFYICDAGTILTILSLTTCWIRINHTERVAETT